MARGLIRKMMFGVVVGTIALGGASYMLRDVDPENPKGREICYLSEEDDGLPVTKADVDCDRVVIGIPQEVLPKKDCGIYFKLEEDGKCHYYPPESSEESFDI